MLSNVQTFSNTDGFSAIDIQMGVKSTINTPFQQTRDNKGDRPISENVNSYPYDGEDTMPGSRMQNNNA
jgi:hypothetical protein